MNPPRLDSPKGRSYKVALFLTLALSSSALAAGREGLEVRGAVLPYGSEQIGEDRYKSSLNYTDTLAYYKKQYRGNLRKTIVNQPGIRAVHIVNGEKKGEWEGLNVYELEGETRIFVIKRDPPPATPKASGKDVKPKGGR